MRPVREKYQYLAVKYFIKRQLFEFISGVYRSHFSSATTLCNPFFLISGLKIYRSDLNLSTKLTDHVSNLIKIKLFTIGRSKCVSLRSSAFANLLINNPTGVREVERHENKEFGKDEIREKKGWKAGKGTQTQNFDP